MPYTVPCPPSNTRGLMTRRRSTTCYANMPGKAPTPTSNNARWEKTSGTILSDCLFIASRIHLGDHFSGGSLLVMAAFCLVATWTQSFLFGSHLTVAWMHGLHQISFALFWNSALRLGPQYASYTSPEGLPAAVVRLRRRSPSPS